MQARDLPVPWQAHVVRAPRPTLSRAARLEVEDALLVFAVAQDEKRPAAALGFDALAQLGGGGAVRLRGEGLRSCLGRQGTPG